MHAQGSENALAISHKLSVLGSPVQVEGNSFTAIMEAVRPCGEVLSAVCMLL